MAAPAGGLAVVLTIGMVAWLAAPIHTGSPGSGWWGTQEALKLSQAARALFQKGDYSGAESVYRQAGQIAARHHDLVGQAWCTSGIGGIRFAHFDYRGAGDAYLLAKALAVRARDPLVLGAVDLDLASLYQQMWDSRSAREALEQGLQIVQGLSPVFYRPQMLQLLGRLRADRSSIDLYRTSIAKAAESGSSRGVEASGWRLLGLALLDQGDLKGAGEALEKALAIGRTRQEVGAAQWAFGKLRLKQADSASGENREKLLAQAAELNARAIEAEAVPAYELQYQRGRVLLAQRRVQEALESMREAIRLAQLWRVGIVPAQTSVDSVATALQQDLFDHFIATAVDFGAQFRNPGWIEAAFEATELNRAINLRDSPGGSRSSPEENPGDTVPAAYWSILGRLKREEEKSRAASQGGVAIERLESRLTELEAKAGLGYLPNIAENFPSHGSLIHFQHTLKDSDLFLSFGLERRESFVWAVTRNSFRVYRLPPAEQIVSAVRKFRETVEDQSTVEDRPVETAKKRLEDQGKLLYGMLFGQLSPAEASRPAWLLSVSDALLELPFGALTIEPAGVPGRQFLAERHSLEVRAGALLAGPVHASPRGGILAVGDPIYNTSDPRWVERRSRWALWGERFGLLPTPPELNRLPGTRREIDVVAGNWPGSPKLPGEGTTVLTGAAATRADFVRSLSPVPRVIHIATHALAGGLGGDPDGHASLAFGLGENAEPELLTSSEIRTLRVPGSVVVMTGCETAPRGVPSGLGLAGLVRAWTVAGASSVVATEWPVDDASGSPVLAAFYRHLRSLPGARPAEALQRAQIDMIHSGTAQAAPAVWAAYQAFGGEPGTARSNAP